MAAPEPDAQPGPSRPTWQAWHASNSLAQLGSLHLRPGVAMAPRDPYRPSDATRLLPALTLGGVGEQVVYLVPKAAGGLLLMLQLTP